MIADNHRFQERAHDDKVKLSRAARGAAALGGCISWTLDPSEREGSKFKPAGL